MGSLDWTVFHWLNGQAGQHGWLDTLGKAAATQLALVIVLTLVAGWLLAAALRLWRDRELPRGLVVAVLVAGIALGLALLANQVISQVWLRHRPFVSHPRAHLLVSHASDASFPSDHATAGFALSLGAARSLPRTGAVVFAQTVLLSAGRVFVGLHYPGDILGSLLVVAVAALVATWLVGRAGGIIDRAVSLVNGRAERRHWPVRLG